MQVIPGLPFAEGVDFIIACQNLPLNGSAADVGIHRLQKNGVAVSLLGDPDGTLFKSILYVRQTSVELRGHIRQVMQSSARDGVITRKRFAVTGTPGIGKSSFSNYFAAMVLREGKTVFYQFKEEYGVVLEPGKNGQPPQATIYDVLTAFHGVARRADAESGWYVIDSATPIVSKVPALLVTSTQPRFYNEWLKQGGGAPFYMQLPEEEEIHSQAARCRVPLNEQGRVHRAI